MLFFDKTIARDIVVVVCQLERRKCHEYTNAAGWIWCIGSSA
jgi:hypothetical protein